MPRLDATSDAGDYCGARPARPWSGSHDEPKERALARSPARHRRLAATVASLLLLAGGYAVADALDVVPGPVTTAPAVPEPAPFPAISASPAARHLATLDPAVPQPSAAALTEIAERLVSDPRTGGTVGVVVADALTGETLVDIDGTTPRTPASSLKLLVALAALDAYGPDHELRTSVVAGEPGQVVLVGGGDILLAAGGSDDAPGTLHRASLDELAEQTAAALEDDGAVSVVVDDSLFSGPGYAPGWGGIDFDFVMPIGPLAVDGGLAAAGGYVGDPALAAGQAFAQALAGAGVEVTGEVGRGVAPADGTELAAVTSAPLADVVGHMLAVSDNSVAEVLGRLVALADDEEPSFAGATRAVADRLAALGIETDGLVLADLSGLLIENQVPAQTLAQVVSTALDPEHPELHGAVAGLPVAALEGTLRDRMAGAAAGVLRAKTGTLTTVASLTGLVLDADGRLLVFAVLADELELGGVGPARAAIDDWADELAACGCR
ncbi:D-alanyl-D-alanine carboxypeptidase/D-alanyl-D-alanine-endopeptidase [Georgenia sp. MJ173]|uniref:D-alanyl-D-alanine carboxypeptidase/D-alanyl-D-alanine endopeptidase n=1 Tax=Georgenia sunbinii TaxID=3117728 RepID=UPI002F26C173